MKKNTTNLILIISTILLFVFLATFVYVLNIIKNKNNHSSVVSSTLAKKIIEKGEIRTLEKKMSELKEIDNKIAGFFVNTSRIDTFVEYLENIGVDNNVVMTVNSVDSLKNDKTKVIVGLNMTGDFSNLMKIIAILENSPYYVKISSSYLNKEIEDDRITVAAVVDNTAPAGDKNTNPVNKVKEPVKKAKNQWQAEIVFSVSSLQY